MSKLLYKVSLTYDGNYSTLSNSASKLFDKERDSLPEFVVATNLAEAISKVAAKKLKFYVPREFTIVAQGNILA